jgi:hypothetical protein
MANSFMDFLNRVDSVLLENAEEDVVEVVETPKKQVVAPKKKTVVKKDPTVKDMEKKLKEALDGFGLKKEAIEDICSVVFNGVSTIKGYDTQSTNTAPNFKQNNFAQPTVESKNNMVDYADYLLEGVPEMTSKVVENTTNNTVTISDLNLNNVEDHASALLG